MIRAPLGNKKYWDEWTAFRSERLDKEWAQIQRPSANPTYRAQYVWNSTLHHFRLAMTLYSKGGAVTELLPVFCRLLDAWELSDELSVAICSEFGLRACRDWVYDLQNLNHYNWCFSLLGLALSLDVSAQEWGRLCRLIGGGGEDLLLDKVIFSRDAQRVIGDKLLHPKPYALLARCLECSSEESRSVLRDFVEGWYSGLERKGGEELWWYRNGGFSEETIKDGLYFGAWCVEAVAVVKAYSLDDSLCLNCQNYPGELSHTGNSEDYKVDTSSTKRWWSRFF